MDGKILPNFVSRCHTNNQRVFNLELGDSLKPEFVTENENITQHIPVAYFTTNNPVVSSEYSNSLLEPVTYVLSNNFMTDSRNYCSVRDNEQRILIVQEVNQNPTKIFYENTEAKMIDINDRQISESKFLKVQSVNGKTESWEEKEMVSDIEKVEKRSKSKTFNTAGAVKGLPQKKISCVRKSLHKKKNLKMKTKPKTTDKVFTRKLNTNLSSVEEKAEKEKDAEKRNLFELTKLEDNVEQVAERLKIGCECSDTNCFDGLNPEEVFKHRLNIADLTKAEHDMFLMGVIMASIHNLEETSRHKERIRIRSCYAYQGKKVCLTAFLYLQHVTLYQMKRLRSHLKNHGVSPRIHGNRGRKPANTFSLDIYRRAMGFVQNYIEQNSVKTTPNFTTYSTDTINPSKTSIHPSNQTSSKNDKVKIANKMTSYHLPPDCTKRVVHAAYKNFCENHKPSQKVMKYSTFTSFLKKQFPNVKFLRKEEKKLERSVSKADEAERVKRNESGIHVNKTVLMDKNLIYIPSKTHLVVNGQKLELYDENEGFGAGNRDLVSGQSYNVNQTLNSEPYFAVKSTV